MTNREYYRLHPGRHTYGWQGINFVGKIGHVYTGNFCSIASDIRIITVGHHVNRVTTYPFDVLTSEWGSFGPIEDRGPKFYGDVLIGHDVWIGYGVTIMGGVKIGNGSVIAAKSVVTRNVASYDIVAGNPATVKKFRFPVSIKRRLEVLKWWLWPDSMIKERAHDMMTLPISDFCTKYEREPHEWEPQEWEVPVHKEIMEEFYGLVLSDDKEGDDNG